MIKFKERQLRHLPSITATLMLTGISLASNAQAPEEGASQTNLNLGKMGLNKPSDQEYYSVPRLTVKRVNPTALSIERANAEFQKQGRSGVMESRATLPENEVETYYDNSTSKSAERPVTATSGQSKSVTATPSSVDNSQLPSFPPIGDQSFGSCGPWAATYYLASHQVCLIKGCDNKTSNANILSPSWSYNLLNGGNDGGTDVNTNFLLLEKHGAPSVRDVPVKTNDFRKWSTDSKVWRSALDSRLNPLVNLSDLSTPEGLANLKQYLANGNLVTVASTFIDWQYTKIKAEPGSANSAYQGQAAVKSRMSNSNEGGHMTAIVGYDDKLWVDINNNGAVDAGERGALKMANSWGSGWGNKGFMWIPYDAILPKSNVVGAPLSNVNESMFWWDTAVGATANPTKPQLIAEFTVNHGRRSQMSLALGSSEPIATLPDTSTVINSIGLRNRGGDYAFDGGNVPVDGNFVLDASGLLPAKPASTKYYLKLSDNATGMPLTLKALKLIDTQTNQEYLTNTGLSLAVDKSVNYAVVTYNNAGGNLAPTAVIQATQASDPKGVTVAFNGTGSTDSDGKIASYSWNFGDGSGPATNSVISHRYEKAGNFMAVLTVIDDKGAKGAASYAVSVTLPNAAPVANITASSSEVTAGASVDFNGTKSSDSDGTIAKYQWDFGDNTPGASTSVVKHVYSVAGSYTARLTVTDNRGGVGVATVMVKVNPVPPNPVPPVPVPPTPVVNQRPVSVVKVTLTPVEAGTNAALDATGSYDRDGTVVTYMWTLGDDSPRAYGDKVNHVYAKPGRYMVRLTVTDNKGLKGYLNYPVVVPK